MVFVFYYDLLSQPCRALYLFFKAAGVEFESKVIDLTKGEHHEPEFLKKNPFHKIPIIDEDGFVLAESVAIMRYVATKNNLADHWFPRADPRQMAREDEFLNWQHLCVRKPCVDLFLNLFRSRIGVGRFTKIDLDVAKVKAAKEDVVKSVAHIADYFLQERQFICGDEISAADIIGVMELVQLDGVEEADLYRNNEKVNAWTERVKARLQPHYDESIMKLKYVTKMYIDAK